MHTRFRVLPAPQGGGTCTITPAAGGERAGVEGGEILTDAHGSDSLSGKPVGKGESKQ